MTTFLYFLLAQLFVAEGRPLHVHNANFDLPNTDIESATPHSKALGCPSLGSLIIFNGASGLQRRKGLPHRRNVTLKPQHSFGCGPPKPAPRCNQPPASAATGPQLPPHLAEATLKVPPHKATIHILSSPLLLLLPLLILPVSFSLSIALFAPLCSRVRHSSVRILYVAHCIQKLVAIKLCCNSS